MIKVIAFDADDTLWVNEPFFREAEEEFASLMEAFMPRHSSIKELYRTEIENLNLYGYGIKGFMLSMIQTAMRISDHKIPVKLIERILEIGNEMLLKPVEILLGVEEVLADLNQDFRLVMATKGDLVDQERKLKKSGLDHYFHHIEIMSEKKEADFAKLIRHLDVAPNEFLMMGNSLKSDVLPVLALGGHAIHIPFHITWEHERSEHEVKHENFYQAEHIAQVVDMIKGM
ncbi:HAD family hydrolase [Algoriphagus halophytocola]|uniref:HAD family hydrolase n=1 Tax=Algoriphagus halophytocola TaxID=2991499 RepID=A0ABY6MLY6_9BACT|nr:MULTISPECIES: HAD family hydrolase [unclassified Algoriphagus]UZD24178.1 HAD family hydrolase [Algoriphagus sp. TR-M5]WBL41549.1 HAD family hydrolase [Algoriphagus sp. TR-M9]